VPREAVKKVVVSLVDALAGGNLATFARMTGVPKTTVWYWAQGTTLPQVEQWLILAHAANQSLPELLTGATSTWQTVGAIRLEPYRAAHSERKTGRPVQRIPLDKVRSEMVRLLNLTPPMSLHAFSRQIGYDSRFLKRRFPDLAQAISKRFSDYRAVLAANRLHKLTAEVTAIVHELHNEGLFPSPRLVSSRLSSPASFREKAVRETWKALLRELGYWTH